MCPPDERVSTLRCVLHSRSGSSHFDAPTFRCPFTRRTSPNGSGCPFCNLATPSMLVVDQYLSREPQAPASRNSDNAAVIWCADRSSRSFVMKKL